MSDYKTAYHIAFFHFNSSSSYHATILSAICWCMHLRTTNAIKTVRNNGFTRMKFTIVKKFSVWFIYKVGGKFFFLQRMHKQMKKDKYKIIVLILSIFFPRNYLAWTGHCIYLKKKKKIDYFSMFSYFFKFLYKYICR